MLKRRAILVSVVLIVLAFAAGAAGAFNSSMMSTVGASPEKPKAQPNIKNVDGSEKKTFDMLADIESLFKKK